MSNLRTLKEIRKNAPQEDRNSEALAPSASVPARSSASRYVPVNLIPQDLEQLKERSGPYARAAAVEALWSAVQVWLMWHSGEELKLTNPSKIANLSVLLCANEDRWRLQYPSLTEPFGSVFQTLSSDVQEEARRVAAETMAAWEQAGSPGLLKSIESTNKYIQACIRQDHERKAA
jgi:hypothetical protein